MADIAPGATLGFVGLGNMGLPMARRLVEAGYQVRAFDVAAPARQAAAQVGATVVENLAGVAEGAAAVLLILPDSTVVASVLHDPALLKALRPGTVVVDMSSAEPQYTKTLGAELAGHGIRMVDAPVSGGVKGANGGTLTVMLGGADADAEAVTGLLGAFGRVVRAGGLGAGHAVKALNNLLSATHLWVTCEAIEAGQRFGLDPEVMLSIFNTSSGKSGSTENKWPNFILPGTFNSGFGARLMLKDMRIAVRLAEQLGVPSRLGADAVGLWDEAVGELAPAADHTEIARWISARASASAGTDQDPGVPSAATS